MSCHKCVNEDPNEIKSPPAKRPKIVDDVCMDPLVKLPEPVTNEIMSYLTGKELLSAMEVSKLWRDFIKVRSGLMDKLVFKPTVESCKLPILNVVYDEDTKRHYKHLVTPVNLYNKYYINISPITIFASTLETLVLVPNSIYIEDHQYCNQFCKIIKTYDPDLDVEQCDFPKLRMLTYSFHPYKLPFFVLKGFTFPALTHLRIKSNNVDDESVDLRQVVEFVKLFPNLKVLMIDIDEDCFLSNDFGFVIEPPVTLDENQPKIKAIYSTEYFPNFTKQYQSSLEILEIQTACQREIHAVLEDLKALKTLSVNVTLHLDEDKKFVLNESIEVLKIWNISEEVEGHQRLRNIILALPSLKELTVYKGDFITPDTLKFLGKKLIK